MILYKYNNNLLKDLIYSKIKKVKVVDQSIIIVVKHKVKSLVVYISTLLVR